MIWRRYVAGATPLAVASAVVPEGAASYGLHVLVAASALAALAIGFRMHPPARVAPAYAIGLALLLWVVGDAAYFGRLQVGLPVSPRVAELCYAAAYAAAIAGLLLLLHTGRGRVRGREGRIDTAIYTVNVTLVSWVFLVQPSWEASSGESVVDRVVAIGYPLADIVIVAACLRLATIRGGGGPRRPAVRLAASSAVLLLAADSMQQLGLLGSTVDPRVLETLWLLGYVLLGAAALHPAARTITDVGVGPESWGHRGRVVGLAVAILLGPAVIVVEILFDLPGTPWPVLASDVVIICLVALRMWLLVERLSEQSRRLAVVAETDHTTGLPNRRRLADELATALSTPAHHGALLVIEVEHLTEIMESIGYSAGDEILEEIARRLCATAGPAVVVARIGAATFGVLLPGVTSAAAARAAAIALRAAVERPVENADLGLAVDTVAGGVLLAEGARQPHGAAMEPQYATVAIGRARAALRAARASGLGVALYTPDMDADDQSGNVVGEVRAALAAGQIVLHYQPQIDLETGRVLGVEALARWAHPDRGLLAPAHFIPAVERSGLIGPFTRHVLDSALAQCATWRAEGLVLTVAVNLSVRNLLDPKLVDEVAAALARYGLDPSALELEITETTAMTDPRRSLAAVSALAAMGVALSVDDYGTGYSSLAYLQRLPVRRLKMDRSFVSGICTDVASAAIVRSTVELARNLALDVMAEGVEDDETWDALREMGCFGAQGYGIGRPAPAGEIVALVAAIEKRFGAMVASRQAALPMQRSGRAARPAVSRRRAGTSVA